MKNLSRNKKKGKHTDDDGWTTINVNSNHKPKRMDHKQTMIKSIISTINIYPQNVKKGAPEAKIDLPTRENRYTLPEEDTTQEEEEKKLRKIRSSNKNKK
jgi:hypothetical protein